MQEPIPYRSYNHAVVIAAGSTSPAQDCVNSTNIQGVGGSVQMMLEKKPVVVLGRRGCCMCHVERTLLLGHGVNPAVFEVDDGDEAAVLDELSGIDRVQNREIVQFPAVFVGGKLFGGLDRVMATHISGDLVPILKDAGALWL